MKNKPINTITLPYIEILCNNCRKVIKHIKLFSEDHWFHNYINEYYICLYCGNKRLIFSEYTDGKEETKHEYSNK